MNKPVLYICKFESKDISKQNFDIIISPRAEQEEFKGTLVRNKTWNHTLDWALSKGARPKLGHESFAAYTECILFYFTLFQILPR